MAALQTLIIVIAGCLLALGLAGGDRLPAHWLLFAIGFILLPVGVLIGARGSGQPPAGH